VVRAGRQRDAYLGLGSNVGDRRERLRAALDELQRAGLVRVSVSSLYESEALGPVTQDRFINAVACFTVEIGPRRLLARCLEIEQTLGRQPGVLKGPRVIDIDLLLVDDAVCAWPELVLPHPELTRRAFVLQPLLEIAPELTDPRDGRPLHDHLLSVSEQKIWKVEEAGWER
jgi:2-amino-4-hydroxy-6-hydroxymethyldihydropteridine diphosphokinase